MIPKNLLALGLLLTLGCQPALAAMYKWTDAEGNVHYGEQPPPNSQAERMKAPPPPADHGQDPLTLNAKNKDKGEDGDTVEARKRQALIRKNCEAARNNLAVYTAHRRIKEGENVMVLDDDERQRRIKRAKQNIEKYCQ